MTNRSGTEPDGRGRPSGTTMQDHAFRRLSEEPILCDLLGYWERKRGDKEVPDRRDIDPTEMPPSLLPHLCLIEICENDRLKLRLVGTEIVRQHKRDNTGKFVDEYLKGDYLAYLTALYLELRARRLPVLTESVFRHPGTHLETTRLLLPLTWGGADLRLVLMGQVFRYRSGHPNLPIAQPLDAGSLEILNQITLDRVARDATRPPRPASEAGAPS
jgi:hypothetical protein